MALTLGLRQFVVSTSFYKRGQTKFKKMGLSRHKVTYKCDCGVDYGDCGAKCAFVFVNNRTVDVYHIFHIDTHHYRGNSEEKPQIEQVICFGDSALSALRKLLETSESSEELTELERETCRP